MNTVKEVKTGEVIRVGDLELTPVNQVIKIITPGKQAGFIWNRPKAVVVIDGDGQEKIVPVVDTTRIVIWTMLAGAILGALSMGLLQRHR
jgi:hypothetical protein